MSKRYLQSDEVVSRLRIELVRAHELLNDFAVALQCRNVAFRSDIDEKAQYLVGIKLLFVFAVLLQIERVYALDNFVSDFGNRLELLERTLLPNYLLQLLNGELIRLLCPSEFRKDFLAALHYLRLFNLRVLKLKLQIVDAGFHAVR